MVVSDYLSVKVGSNSGRESSEREELDGEESGEEGAMAKKEESEMVKLMKYMVDRECGGKGGRARCQECRS